MLRMSMSFSLIRLVWKRCRVATRNGLRMDAVEGWRQRDGDVSQRIVLIPRAIELSGGLFWQFRVQN